VVPLPAVNAQRHWAGGGSGRLRARLHAGRGTPFRLADLPGGQGKWRSRPEAVFDAAVGYRFLTARTLPSLLAVGAPGASDFPTS